MASDSQPHATGPGARPICDKVTAQHTLERVRNNQRRHRARQKDYIATLEQKLNQAEQSAMTLRDQINTLQTELAQCRSQNRQTVTACTLLPGQLQSNDSGTTPAQVLSPGEADFQAADFQALDLLPDVGDLGVVTPSSSLPFPLPLPDNLSDGFRPELVDLISPHTGPEDANGPAEYEIPQALVPLPQLPKYTGETPIAVVPRSTGSAPDLSLQGTNYQLIGGIRSLISATATSKPIPTATGICCSNGRCLKPDDDKTDEHTTTFSRENPPLLPEYVFQPPMPAYYRYDADGKSTMLCAEAYVLIAQQNFKGVNERDVATWLWKGFRKSLSPGEGCRIKTDLLFSLLDFISDA